jgi:ribosomal protein S8E
MAYDATKPADDEFLAAFPPEMREQLRAIIQDAIVDAGKLAGLTAGNASGNIPVSNGVVNTGLNAEKHGGNLPAAYATAGHGHAEATGSSDGFMANTDKTKIDTVAANAEVNQVAFSNVLVGATIVQSTSKTGTVEFMAGTNIGITADNVNKKLTINVTGKVASATVADSAAVCTGNSLTASSTPGNAATATNATTHIGLASGAHAASAISGLAVVATSGSYADLSAKPTSLPADGGNAATATALATARLINGVSFNGTGNIAITTANGGTIATTDQIPAPGNSVSILTGIIAHGATIPLPAGYTQAQCRWMVSPSTYIDIGLEYATSSSVCSANGTRSVTYYSNALGGACGTVNYIIVGVK